MDLFEMAGKYGLIIGKGKIICGTLSWEWGISKCGRAGRRGGMDITLALPIAYLLLSQ